jgi:hypothetical protein
MGSDDLKYAMHLAGRYSKLLESKEELAQKILILIKEAYDRAEGRDEAYRVGCYALALSDIEKLCKEQE